MGETISKSIAQCTCPVAPNQSEQRLDQLEASVDRLVDLLASKDHPVPPAPIEAPRAPGAFPSTSCNHSLPPAPVEAARPSPGAFPEKREPINPKQ